MMPTIGNPAPTILIVDDDPNVCDVLQQAFAADGYEASAVATSIDCLALLETGAKFDLLVLDVLMTPGEPHGFSLGRMARRRIPGQKIMYISGVIDSWPEAELKNAEAPVLAKPVRIAEVIETAQRVLASG
jgi:CheY-like chemotaxis protein